MPKRAPEDYPLAAKGPLECALQVSSRILVSNSRSFVILTPGVMRREELSLTRHSSIKDQLSHSRSERNLIWKGFCQLLCIRLVGSRSLPPRWAAYLTVCGNLEEQVERAYGQYASHESPIGKNSFMTSLKYQNDVWTNCLENQSTID